MMLEARVSGGQNIGLIKSTFNETKIVSHVTWVVNLINDPATSGA